MNGRKERNIQYEKKIQALIQKCGDSQILTNYNKYLGSSKEPNTIFNYMVYITEFMRYLSKESNIKKITLDVLCQVKPFEIADFIITRYKKRADGEEYSTEHAALCWSALNSFYKFLCSNYEEEIGNNNPVAKTERPKLRSKAREDYLTPKEIKKFMDSVKFGERYNGGRLDSIKFYLGARDYLMFKLFIQLGLRSSAVVGINLYDIDKYNKTLTVREKGDKEFIYDLDDNIIEAYDKWCVFRSTMLDYDDESVDALFISHRKSRMVYNTLYKLTEWYGDYIGHSGLTPHALRHTFGTNLYNITKDIRLVQEEMHHSKITTTERYITVSKDKKQEARAKMAALVNA